MKITEIFESINGESKFAGLRTVFVRAHGCNLNCSYCDSRYACEGDAYTEMTVDEIVKEVNKYDCKRVTYTGGEPLCQPDAVDLIRKLYVTGYSIEIETNGAVDISEVVDIGVGERVTVTMDWKCFTSGMRSKMLDSNLKKLHSTDVVKCVVGSKEDLDEMKRITEETFARVYVSPVFGKIEPKDIVQYVLDNKLNSVRVQVQLHKIIWNPNERGV